jgi:hypothetical protein
VEKVVARFLPAKRLGAREETCSRTIEERSIPQKRAALTETAGAGAAYGGTSKKRAPGTTAPVASGAYRTVFVAGFVPEGTCLDGTATAASTNGGCWRMTEVDRCSVMAHQSSIVPL